MRGPGKKNRRRLWVMVFFVAMAFLFLVGRLAYIQIIHGEVYKKMAMKQQTRSLPIAAKRGSIYDTKGVKLAFSRKSFTVWVHPADISKEREDFEKVVQSLSEILEMDAVEVKKRLTKNKKVVTPLKRFITKVQADLIRNKRFAGISIAQDNKRVYPNLNFAAHILGHTTIDSVGLTGLERVYEKELKGKAGTLVINADAAGRRLPFGKEKTYPPEDGLNLVLTIDEIIQHFVEEALEKGLETHGAKRIMAIVMEPKTGGILAMATKPDYNPNEPRDMSYGFSEIDIANLTEEEKVNLWNRAWKNPNLNETYEPGSTFKLLTTAIAFEENTASPGARFSTPGYVDLYGFRIKNWDYPASHKNFTLIEALEKSLNTTFIELAQGIGKKTFYKYLINFGLVDKTGIDLPGESRSLLLPEEKIGPVELATISFGHGIAVTPLQMVSAINALANDGALMQPHIVRGFENSSGEMTKEIAPKLIRQVVSSKTAKDVRRLMELVVTEGSGKLAYIPGIRIGGKTGTSEKIVNGTYSDELAYASFVAIAPVDDPKVTVLVLVDEPKDTNFGSQTAAPIAKDILEDTLRYVGVEPDISGKQKMVKVPQLIGKTKEQAQNILEASGLSYTTEPMRISNEQSLVLDQFPYAGTLVTSQDIVILKIDAKVRTEFDEKKDD